MHSKTKGAVATTAKKGKSPMPMVTKDGKKVPAFATDGKGKMFAGGMAKKGYAAGGKIVHSANEESGTKSKVRGAGIAIRGVRPAKMM